MAKKERAYEVKTMPAWTKDIDGRIVPGITAVMGNVDDGGDRIIQGAFLKTIAENAPRFRHLWQHGADGWDYGVTPPTAVIKSIREVGRDALPAAVIEYAPMATGGLEVVREYLPTPRGDEILAAYVAGIHLEMSIGYECIIKKWIDEDSQRVSFGHYRDLIELKLYDTSDVNWGMNAAAVGSKHRDLKRRLIVLVERMKTLRGELPAETDELAEQLRDLREELLFWEKRDVANPGAPIEFQPEPDQAEPNLSPMVSLTSSLLQLQKLELALIH